MTAGPLNGGCACGAIRYTSLVLPLAQFNCHCRDCQKSSGSAYSPVFVVPTQALVVQGQPKSHERKSESGANVKRSFCAECGSPLFSTGATGELTSVKAGSLDEPARFQPSADLWVQSAQPWDCMAHSLPKFPKAAPPVPGFSSPVEP